MKKLFAVLLIAVMAAMTLCSCSVGVNYTYDNASKYTAGDVSSDEAPKNLDIDWVSGRIRIEYGKDDKFTAVEKITSTSTTKNAPMYTWLDGDTLRIKFLNSGRTFFETFSKVLTITVPKDTKFEKINVNSVSADVILLDAEAKNINIDVVSGSLTANGCAAKKLKFNAVSGGLHISDSTFDSVKSDSISGVVTYVGNTLPADFDIDTVSGMSVFEIRSENCGFTLDFNTVSGSKTIDLPVVEKDGKTVYGDGSANVNINSVSGGINISSPQKAE